MNLRQIIQDLRFGARLFTKSPGFAAAGVAIVALGIGAATAVFSVVYGVMLQPLPFREPERLVDIWLSWPATGARTLPSAADALDLQQLRGAYQDVAFLDNENLNLLGQGDP